MWRGRRIAVVTVVTAFAAWGSFARGDDSPPADLEREVRRLIDDLGAATRATRSTAETRLVELGPQVLKHLPAPELLPTVSVREAVGRARLELERRQARESVKASRVTLEGTRPLAEWLGEIAAQTGNAFDAGSLPAATLARETMRNDRAREFWPVLDDLAAQHTFAFEPEPNRRGLSLQATPFAGTGRWAPIVGYTGPFRILARPVELKPIADRRARSRLARVSLFVQAEPRLRPLFLRYAAGEITASLKGKDNLAPFSPDADVELPLGAAGPASRMQLDYVLPAGTAPEPLDLNGKLNVTMAASGAEVRFRNVAAGADGKEIGIERRHAGVTVTLQRVRREKLPDGKSELRVRIAVAYDRGGPAFESHRSWMLHNQAFLEGPDGKRIPYQGGFEMTMQADGAAGMEYRFVDLPEPSPEFAFVYVAPMLIIDVPVEFALKSVPFENER